MDQEVVYVTDFKLAVYFETVNIDFISPSRTTLF